MPKPLDVNGGVVSAPRRVLGLGRDGQGGAHLFLRPRFHVEAEARAMLYEYPKEGVRRNCDE